MQCYLAWNTNQDELIKSTSGGLFYLIGKRFIDSGDYVCGCVWDDDFEGAHHIVSNKIEDLERMRGSKYVRSALGHKLFSDISTLLLTDKRVLFSGCPCHIYALKFYLQRLSIDIKNLYTFSIICNSTTKQSIFKEGIQKLKESHIDANIVFMNQRDKQLGWLWEKERSIVNFDDGSSEISPVVGNPILDLFLVHKKVNESCIQCRFKTKDTLQGDIISGDYWGVATLYPDDTNKFGNSAVIVMTQKGEELFNGIRDSIHIKDTDFNAIKSRNKFLLSSIVPNNHVYTSPVVDKPKDIGILTFFNANNVGAKLQTMCLKFKIKELFPNTNPIVIDFRDDNPGYNLPKRFDMVVIGSDQIWCPDTYLYSRWPMNIFFGKGLHAKSIISYAPSSNGYSTDILKLYMSRHNITFSEFKSISVRDTKTAELVKIISGRDSTVVLDPSLLVDNFDFLTDAENTEETILVYAYKTTQNEKQLIETFANEVKLPVEYVGANVGIDDGLESFKKAKYIFTKTFHGILISIAYRKKFFLLDIGNNYKVNEIIKMFRLQDRIIKNQEHLSSIYSNTMNYDMIEFKMFGERKKSELFLKKSIEDYL